MILAANNRIGAIIAYTRAISVRLIYRILFKNCYTGHICQFLIYPFIKRLFLKRIKLVCSISITGDGITARFIKWNTITPLALHQNLRLHSQQQGKTNNKVACQNQCTVPHILRNLMNKAK